MKKEIALIVSALLVITGIVIVMISGGSDESLTDIYPANEQVTIDSNVTDPLLREKILGQMLPPDRDNAANFCAVEVFSCEKISESEYYVYAWVMESTYSYDGGVLNEDGGASYPCRFELEKESDTFKVTAADTPGDGAQYSEDIKKLFPRYVREQIAGVQDDGTVRRLTDENLRLAKERFGAE